MLKIQEIAKKLGVEENIENYGFFKAKIDFTKYEKLNKKGKLILVTSTSPTPYGEGKTTISIGLNDALCKIGKNSVAVLREPSMGPVFGIKGGAVVVVVAVLSLAVESLVRRALEKGGGGK